MTASLNFRSFPSSGARRAIENVPHAWGAPWLGTRFCSGTPRHIPVDPLGLHHWDLRHRALEEVEIHVPRIFRDELVFPGVVEIHSAREDEPDELIHGFGWEKFRDLSRVLSLTQAVIPSLEPSGSVANGTSKGSVR